MEILNQFIDLAKELSSRFSSQDFSVQSKINRFDKRELVTGVDLFSQQVLLAVKDRFHEGYTMISEELNNFGELSSDGKGMVIIDPLDGTHNFVYGLPMWGFSYSVFDSVGKPLESYICLPEFNVILVSAKDNNVFTVAIDTGKCSPHKPQAGGFSENNFTVAYDNQFYKGDNDSYRLFDALSRTAFSIRITGCAVFDIFHVFSKNLSARIWHNVDIYDVAPVFGLFSGPQGHAVEFPSGNEATLKTKNLIVTRNLNFIPYLFDIGWVERSS